MWPCYYIYSIFYATIISYELEFPPAGKKIVSNLLNGDDFTNPYIIDTTTNSPAGYMKFQHKLRIFCGLFPLMGKNPSQKQLHLMNYSAIGLNV